jgi:aspartate/methionine/tyrosine aminotransferase
MQELEANRRTYADNRALLLAELPKAGLGAIVPADGAFYLYVDVSEHTRDSVAFAKEMLTEIGIAATPGVDFDSERGARYVRFCYSGTAAQMLEATRRLRAWGRLSKRR